jgi:uncharacterized 2Fe-2S/4Fe-4S cluster protein (DUF4445 family)
MLATQMDALDGPTLMVDIGTNGEIVLPHQGVAGGSTAGDLA